MTANEKDLAKIRKRVEDGYYSAQTILEIIAEKVLLDIRVRKVIP